MGLSYAGTCEEARVVSIEIAGSVLFDDFSKFTKVICGHQNIRSASINNGPMSI